MKSSDIGDIDDIDFKGSVLFPFQTSCCSSTRCYLPPGKRHYYDYDLTLEIILDRIQKPDLCLDKEFGNILYQRQEWIFATLAEELLHLDTLFSLLLKFNGRKKHQVEPGLI